MSLTLSNQVLQSRPADGVATPYLWASQCSKGTRCACRDTYVY